MSSKTYVLKVEAAACQDELNEPMKSESLDVETNCQNCDEIQIANSPIDDDVEDKDFKCTVCHTIFLSLIDLQRHYVHHVVLKPYKCKQCDKCYFKQRNLKKHMIRDHSAARSVGYADVSWTGSSRCPFCSKRYQKKKLFDLHIKKHAFGENVCNLCSREFLCENDLLKHEVGHVQLVDRFCFSCQLCDSAFTLQHELESHYDSHESKSIYACERCDKQFFFKYMLDRHGSIHTSAPKFVCNLCSKEFHKKLDLFRHEKTHTQMLLTESNHTIFLCEYCGCTFHHNFQVEDHYSEHEPTIPNRCKICNKNFFFSYLLYKHTMLHTEGKKYLCDMCPKMFRTKPSFTKHRLDKHIIGQLHECLTCKKRFNTKGALRQHTIAHNDLRAYGCGVCGKRFKRLTNLTRHSYKHSAEKPFKCETCTASFYYKHSLQKHKMKHEPGYVDNHKRRGRIPKIELPKTTVCDVCGKNFKNVHHLLRHSYLHSTNRPYKCEHCDKAVIQKKDMRRHYRYHHPDELFNEEIFGPTRAKRPFKCIAGCRRNFTSEEKLINHINETHVAEGKVVWADVDNCDAVELKIENLNQ